MELIGPNKVTIELSCLVENELTADLYLLLHWKYFNNYKLPEIIKEYLLDDSQALDYLQDKGFIKITSERDFELRQKGILLFEASTPEQKWLEFLGTFPLKVPARNGGTRPLKTALPESKANDKPKAKYISLIKNNPAMHDRIMAVLKAEMAMRKKSGNFQYMNALDAWLNQANYDKYAYLLEEEITTSESYKNEDYM